jgi:phosphoglucosamine mutase
VRGIELRPRLFGSSGIRAVFGRELLTLALKVGLALGNTRRRVVMGYDSRTSSQAMKHALLSGLLASGARVWDSGMVPTPTLAYAVRKFEAGAMITASHNPPQYNGLKLWNPDGSAFDSSQRASIEDVIGGDALETVPWEGVGECRIYDGAIEEHLDRVAADFPSALNIKVVVDSGCGMACLATPYLLKRLGCEVIALNSHPSGLFPRGLEPVPENLGTLMQVVRDSGAHLGIAHDGDGDRMMAVDDRGRFVPGDKLMALFARTLGAKRVITTVDASLSTEDLGLEVVRTRVGDAFVSEELRGGGDLGGEPSGSWIFPNISYCPDGIYAAALIARMAAEERLSQLVDALPAYPLLRGSLAADRMEMTGLEERLREMGPLSISNLDGWRLAFQDGWLLIRPSGTEPRIRVSAEARTEERAQELYNAGIKAVTEFLKGSKV